MPWSLPVCWQAASRSAIRREQRDPKGLYAKARAGELANFTGVDSPYEPPLEPELHLQTENESVDALARRVIAFLDRG